MFKLDHLHIKSHDPQKSSQWYVDNLGATIVRENKGPTGRVSYRLNLHGVEVNLGQHIDDLAIQQTYGLEHVGILSDDVPGTVRKLKAAGARIIQEWTAPSGRKIVFFQSPDGVLFELQEMRS